MNESYDEILGRMTERYISITGFEPDKVSDIGIRLRLLAGEIYSLNSEIEWLKKQMFADTASGIQLEYHAAARSLSRKKGNKAIGNVVFQLDMPLEYNVIIPEGTVCTTSDGSLNYIVTEEKTIRRGQSYAMVTAQAEDSGSRYNIPAGRVTSIVTYFSVGISITNASGFLGGTDDETDDELRERLAENLRKLPVGGNAAYYREAAKSINGVHSAEPVFSGAHSLRLYVAGIGEAVSSQCREELEAYIERIRPLGTSVIVSDPTIEQYHVTASVEPGEGISDDEAIQQARDAINSYFTSLGVGESVRVAGISKAIMECSKIDNCSLNGMSDSGGVPGKLYTAGNIVVGVIE